MQTLYLMNPGYTAYNDPPSSGNMVLLSPSTGLGNQESPLGNPGQQQQQQYAGFSLPPPVPQSQQTQIAGMSNPNIGHHSVSQEIFSNRVNSQGYGWNGGNELSFLPASDLREDTQSLSARLNSMNTGQNPTSGVLSHLDVRNLSQSSFQEQVPFIPSGVALNLSAESLQASTGAGQILSLSLSPQQPSLNQLQSFPIQHPELAASSGPHFSDEGSDKGDRYSNQWMGGSMNSLRPSPSMLGSQFQGQLIGAASSRQVNVLSTSPKIDLYTSKYLRPAQELLNEVVSVGRVAKSSSTNLSKTQSWASPGSFGGGFSQDKNLAETTGKDAEALVSWVNDKDAVSTVSAVPSITAGIQEQNAESVVELSAAERQELQMKKAKLLAMVDEVDQRYRQYHHQIQIVVASFETTAGLGSARTYTALALQTISKHFRCLKDAIRGQIRIACKALGEEVILGQGRGETSRLRFIDQQIRQQRALQQLGMMQQHPWRPQRGLPERSVSVLRAWLFEHFLHPYPKDSDKVLLARQTGLTRNQVSNWFINARVRLWKPMVEEMYAEEVKDGEIAEGADKQAQAEGDSLSKGVGSTGVPEKNEANNPLKQGKILDSTIEGFLETRDAAERDTDLVQNKALVASLSDSFLFQERESLGPAIKRARSNIDDPSLFQAQNLSTSLDVKSYDLHAAHLLTKQRADAPHLENFGIHSEGIVHDDNQNLGGYGMFQLGSLSRYPNESLPTSYPNSNSVSLTLGLQHSDALSVSGTHQQPYIHGQGPLQMGRRQEGEVNAVNYYGMHDTTAAHTGGYEAMNLQDRKRYTGHVLQHDFS